MMYNMTGLPLLNFGQLKHFLIILIEIGIYIKDKCHDYLGT